MLQRVTLDGVELPRLYIAENAADAAIAKDKGIPFVKWTQGNDALIRMLLRPTLEKMFPHIKWNLVLGPRKKFKTKVVITEHENEDYEGKLDEPAEAVEPESKEPEFEEAVEFEDEAEPAEAAEPESKEPEFEEAIAASGSRIFEMTEQVPQTVERKMSIEDYIGDMNSYVNIDVLQRLRLMPSFIGDILDCIKVNAVAGVYWNEGYNKKLGAAVGNFNRSGQLPNLVILDVSGSIPRGISATMITLIDTLRTQLSADLIITSSHSRFYPMGAELPDPQTIRDIFHYSNESVEFLGVLNKNIKGKHYGHVFSFGDNDTPDYGYIENHPEKFSLAGTKVEHVHHYHTGTHWGRNEDWKTGYAKWCHLLSDEPQAEFDQSWCNVIYK